MQEALDRYFPGHRKWTWAMRGGARRDLQIVASGPRRDTSLLVYDNGMGKHLPVLTTRCCPSCRTTRTTSTSFKASTTWAAPARCRSAAIAASSWSPASATTTPPPLGLTLLRRHPPERAEAAGGKKTWYEYLVFDGSVACLEIDELDVGLDGRRFQGGSLLKMYSYRLPEGARSIISRDLNLSLNEFLFEPALPFLTWTTTSAVRTTAPVTPVYGLKRRLEADGDTVETKFSETSTTSKFGELSDGLRLPGAIAWPGRQEDQAVHPARVLQEWHDRPLLAQWPGAGLLLIRVRHAGPQDAALEGLRAGTRLLLRAAPVVRNELFMASRDRLKAGDKADAIRECARDMLLASELPDIARRRKASLSVDSGDAGQMLRDLTRNLPMNEALTRILRQTFDLSDQRPGPSPQAGA